VDARTFSDGHASNWLRLGTTASLATVATFFLLRAVGVDLAWPQVHAPRGGDSTVLAQPVTARDADRSFGPKAGRRVDRARKPSLGTRPVARPSASQRVGRAVTAPVPHGPIAESPGSPNTRTSAPVQGTKAPTQGAQQGTAEPGPVAPAPPPQQDIVPLLPAPELPPALPDLPPVPEVPLPPVPALPPGPLP
jgi:hypothetical protein